MENENTKNSDEHKIIERSDVPFHPRPELKVVQPVIEARDVPFDVEKEDRETTTPEIISEVPDATHDLGSTALSEPAQRIVERGDIPEPLPPAQTRDGQSIPSSSQAGLASYERISGISNDSELDTDEK